MHYLAKHKHENCIFVSNAVLVHRLISTRCCMISSIFDSRLIFTLLYDSLNLVINAFSWGLLGGMVQGKGSQKCCSSWTMLHAQHTIALSSGFPVLQGNVEALER